MSFRATYKFIKQIAAGGQATVFEYENIQTKEHFAVKEITVRREEEFRNQTEIDIINMLRENPHPNVISVKEFFFEQFPSESRYVTHIVMELGEMSLLNYFANKERDGVKFTEDELLDFLEQILNALHHLKRLGVFHRDLKPGNILILPDRQNPGRKVVKITDFGCGKNFQAQASVNQIGQITGVMGTQMYYAPEFKDYFDYLMRLNENEVDNFLKKKIVADYEKADVWTSAYIIMNAYFIARRDARGEQYRLLALNNWENFQKIYDLVHNEVQYKTLRAVLLDVLAQKTNQSRPGFYEYLQSIRMRRWSEAQKAAYQTLYGHTVEEGMLLRTYEVQPRQKVIHNFFARIAEKVNSVTLGQQEDGVMAVAFSPDGKFLASGGGAPDKSVRLWNVETQVQVGRLEGHASDVSCVAFSPDGQLIASSSHDKSVNVWRLAVVQERPVAELLATLKAHKERVHAVAFSPDGKYLATSSADKTVNLFDVPALPRDAPPVATLAAHRGKVTHVQFSPDSTRLASCSSDALIKVWDVAQAATNIHDTLEGHTEHVWSVAYSPDGRCLASSSSDQTVCLWSVADKALICVLKGHQSLVIPIAFSPDGRYVASGSDDQTIRIWSVAEKRQVTALQGHSAIVRAVAFSPDGRFLATGSEDN